jgi:fructosamine-3-kinase
MPDGSPALIDPAVSWNWPETDLSMISPERAPALDRCFAACHEIHPPEPGWRERLLHLRELLCLLAVGRADFALPHVLAVIERHG